MTVYRAVSSLDIVELPEGAILLRSDMGSCTIEGASAQLLAEEVLPRLSRWTALEDLAAPLAGYDPADLRSILDSLVGARLLVSRGAAPSDFPGAAPLFAEMGFDEAIVAEALSEARIGLLGGGTGAAAARRMLEAAGARQVVAFPSDGTRADAVEQLTRDIIHQAAEQLDVMLVAVDRAMLAARHWANQAALASGCPVIFVDVAAIEAVVGPTVLPGDTGCYMCFRMRHLATFDAFAEMMAHERYLDARKDLHFERPAFPGLAEMAAGAAVAELVRLLLPPLTPVLANAVVRIDPLTLALDRHEVLRQPDCPGCQGIDTPLRRGTGG